MTFDEIKKKLASRYPNCDSSYTLYTAVKYNDSEIVKDIINNHLDKAKEPFNNIIPQNGDIPILNLAIENNNIEILNLLLRCDIDRSLRDENGDTALSKAIFESKDEAIALLSANDSNPNNRVNPYRNIIKYVTDATSLFSRGTYIYGKAGSNISFTYNLVVRSEEEAETQLQKIKEQIRQVENEFSITFKDYSNITGVFDYTMTMYQANAYFLISFEQALAFEKRLQDGITEVAENFLNAALQNTININAGTYLGKYLTLKDASLLSRVNKDLNYPFKNIVSKKPESQNSR